VRLTDLDGRFHSFHEGRRGEALGFLCPHCRGCTLLVWLARPMDGGAPIEAAFRQHVVEDGHIHLDPLWEHTGDTIDTISITPSVDASAHGHWHGFVTNGAIT
jgi:hypothetical protein